MSIFVSDTFTAGSDGTAITARSGETGATWTPLSGSGTAPTIFGGIAYTQGVGRWYASGTPAGADYAVSAGYVHGSTLGPVGLMCRLDTSSTSASPTTYLGLYQQSSSKWEVYKVVAGTYTLLGSSSTVSLTAGTTYSLEFSAVGSSSVAVTLKSGGLTVASGTDSSSPITAAGKAGIWTNGGAAPGGTGLDSISAADIGSGLAAGTVMPTVVTGTSVSVSFSGATGGTSPYSYQLQRAPDSSGSPGTYANVGSALTGQTSSATFPTDTGLTTRTRYWYRVVVTDAASGTVNSSGASIITAVPSTFYISPSGSDSNDGLTTGTPWQTISKVNGFTQGPGDQYLFQGGQSFSGTIIPNDSGTASAPIVFGSYGTGKATIACTNQNGYALTDLSWVTVQDLIFSGVGVNTNGTMADASTNKKYAIEFKSTLSSGWLGGVRALRCQVSGCYGGVFVHCDAASTPVGFDGVEIGGTAADPFRVDDGLSFGVFVYGSLAASSTGSPYFLAKGAAQHRGVHVHHFKIQNIYGIHSAADSTYNFWGSGVVICNTTGALVSPGWVKGCGQNGDDSRGGPVGAWALESDSVVFRDVESRDNLKGGGADGGGFDLDGGCVNCVIERCYAHHNAGSGFQVGSYSGSSATSGNIIRHCISEDDGIAISYPGAGFQAFGTTTGTVFERNTVFLRTGTGVAVNNGTHSGLTVRNSAIIAESTQPFVNLPTTATLEGNLYWSQSSAPHWTWGGTSYTDLATLRAATGSPETARGGASGVLADPLLPAVGSGGNVDSAAGPNAAVTAYDPPSNSPAVGAGVAASSGGAADFHGNPPLAGAYPTCGAVEYGTATAATGSASYSRGRLVNA